MMVGADLSGQALAANTINRQLPVCSRSLSIEWLAELPALQVAASRSRLRRILGTTLFAEGADRAIITAERAGQLSCGPSLKAMG